MGRTARRETPTPRPLPEAVPRVAGSRSRSSSGAYVPPHTAPFLPEPGLNAKPGTCRGHGERGDTQLSTLDPQAIPIQPSGCDKGKNEDVKKMGTLLFLK